MVSAGEATGATGLALDDSWAAGEAIDTSKERPEDAEEVDEARNAPDPSPEDAWPAGGRTEVTHSEADGVFVEVSDLEIPLLALSSFVFVIFGFSSSRSCKMICNITNYFVLQHMLKYYATNEICRGTTQ